MATLPPNIYTYHCLCTSLLLTSTHKLSSLPQRTTSSGALDSALILPLPSSPPTFSSVSDLPAAGGEDLPAEGYSILLGVNQDKNVTILRREDGFEKRLLWRCGRCRLVVGYGIADGGEAMDIDGKGKRKGVEEDGYEGKVVYLLPGGITSTDVMAAGGVFNGRKIGEEDMGFQAGGITVFE